MKASKSQKLIQPPQSWEIRPIAPRGDIDAKDIFAAVGEALTEWENVESSLAAIFAVLVSARGRSTFWAPAVQAYGSVISFKGRSDMIRMAAVSYFRKRKAKQSLRDRLQKLLAESLRFSERRNEIAHGQVTMINDYYSKAGLKPRGYYLFPSLYNPKKFKYGGIATFTYMSSDLIHYRQEFTKLHLRLEEFRHELAKRKQSSS
jgi:hypothetical protein